MSYRLTLILAAALLGLISCHRNRGEIGSSGFLETNDAVISAETGGRIERLLVAEGSTVAIGDTLAVIDASRLLLELEAARAGREVAMANLTAARVQLAQAQETKALAAKENDRTVALAASGTATQRQLDLTQHELTSASLAVDAAKAGIATIEAELTRADAEIARLNRQLVDCYPLSPLSGVVLEKFVEAGEVVAPGKAMVRIAQLDTLWVKVYLTAPDFARIKLGERVQVDIEDGSAQRSGTVVWTSDEAEFTPKNVQTQKSRSNLVYAVKVKLVNDDRKLKVGMPVYVTLPAD